MRRPAAWGRSGIARGRYGSARASGRASGSHDAPGRLNEGPAASEPHSSSGVVGASSNRGGRGRAVRLRPRERSAGPLRQRRKSSLSSSDAAVQQRAKQTTTAFVMIRRPYLSNIILRTRGAGARNGARPPPFRLPLICTCCTCPSRLERDLAMIIWSSRGGAPADVDGPATGSEQSVSIPLAGLAERRCSGPACRRLACGRLANCFGAWRLTCAQDVIYD